MISDSVANGGTGDLRLEIAVQDGRFSLKEQRPHLPQGPMPTPRQSAEHPSISVERAKPIPKLVENGKSWHGRSVNSGQDHAL